MSEEGDDGPYHSLPSPSPWLACIPVFIFLLTTLCFRLATFPSASQSANNVNNANGIGILILVALENSPTRAHIAHSTRGSQEHLPHSCFRLLSFPPHQRRDSLSLSLSYSPPLSGSLASATHASRLCIPAIEHACYPDDAAVHVARPFYPRPGPPCQEHLSHPPSLKKTRRLRPYAPSPFVYASFIIIDEVEG